MPSAAGTHLVRRSGARLICQYGEAFALMKYKNKSTGRVEWLWNTRDGVTPFGIDDPTVSDELVQAHLEARRNAPKDKSYQAWSDANRHPGTMYHVDWGEDSFLPIGMRVFFSYADAPASVKTNIAERWAAQLKEYDGTEYDSPELLELLKGQPPFGIRDIDPTIAVVDEEIHRHFHDLARDNPFMPPPRKARAA